MATKKIDKEMRKSLLDARQMMENINKTDANEAETRRRIERFFDTLMGYDVFKHITRELSVHGIGDADYCDFAIQLEQGNKTKPVVLVEIKRVSLELSPKYLKQASSYAINVGCDWVILTNGRVWQIYHITFGQPPQVTLVDSWDLMNDELQSLANKFEFVSYKNVKRGGLDQLWQKRNVLTPHNVLKLVLSESSINMIRRELKKETGIGLPPEEIIGAIRRLLNESALAEIESMKVYLPGKPKISKQKVNVNNLPIDGGCIVDRTDPK